MSSDALSEKEIEIYSQLKPRDFRSMASEEHHVGGSVMFYRFKLCQLGIFVFVPYKDSFGIYRITPLGQKLKRFHEQVEGVLGVD